MGRILLILFIFIGASAIILALPWSDNVNENENTNEISDSKDSANGQIGIPTNDLMDALSNKVQDGPAVGRTANIFNLSYYLNFNRQNNNMTQMTFIPLLTLISGMLGLGGVG